MVKNIEKFILKARVRKSQQLDVDDFITRLKFSQLFIDFV